MVGHYYYGGTLLEPLRDENYFQRFFLDIGTLCGQMDWSYPHHDFMK